MIMKELLEIQTELEAPKGQYNKFGKYYYRNAEDILKALKPLLKKYKCTINVTDELVMVGERYYIKATATLKNESGETEIAAGFAREEENKKGMDLMQLTGATSSYARKYALNGLLAIDDNKDSDTTNKHGKEEPQKTKLQTEKKIDYDKLISDENNSKALKKIAKEHWGNMSDKEKKAIKDKIYSLNFEAYVKTVLDEKMTLEEIVKREKLTEDQKVELVEKLIERSEQDESNS
jgi:hypothetical protein